MRHVISEHECFDVSITTRYGIVGLDQLRHNSKNRCSTGTFCSHPVTHFKKKQVFGSHNFYHQPLGPHIPKYRLDLLL